MDLSQKKSLKPGSSADFLSMMQQDGNVDFKKIMAAVTGEVGGLLDTMGIKMEKEKMDEAMGLINNIIDNGKIGDILSQCNAPADIIKNASVLMEDESFKKSLGSLSTTKETEPVEDIDDLYPTTDDKYLFFKVSLRDLYCGKKKKVRMFRKNFKANANGEVTIFDEEKVLTIVVKPGMKNKTGLVFKGESDRLPNHKPGNVIITLDLQDSSEQMYKRSGDSLLLTVDINLTQNYKLSGQIKTLDGRILSLTCDDKSIVNKNNGIRKIVGEGMPIENTDKKGDLYVRFRVTLPPELSDEKLENLKKVFEVPKIVEDSIPTKVLQLQDSDLTGLDGYESDSDDYYDSDESDDSDDSEESYDDEGKNIEEIVEEMINEK